MTEKWNDIFNAAKAQTNLELSPKQSAGKAQAQRQTSKKTNAQERQSQPSEPAKPNPPPWQDLEPSTKEATVRLNVDIPISLNDRLAAKARQLRQPKTELVRRLLEWALEE